MTTLTAFLAKEPPKVFARRAWVRHPGFAALYVRRGARLLGGMMYADVLDLASLESRIPGTGAFTRLIEWLRDQHPTQPVYIESVLEPRFQRKLVFMGFKRQPGIEPPCYYVTQAFDIRVE